MLFVKNIPQFIDRVSNWSGKTVSWLTLGLLLITAWDVAMRYIFQAGSVAMQELEWHVFSIIFLLAAGYTFKCDEHVRVDIIYARLGERGKAVVDLAGSLLLLAPFCIVIIYTSSQFVESSWSFGEGSGDPGGLPARYILKSMIPLGFFLLLLQGVSLALKSFLQIIAGGRGDEEKGASTSPTGYTKDE